MADRVVLPFNIRPADFEALSDRSAGNKSYLIRKWLNDYTDNPFPFERENDHLVRTSISVPPEMASSIQSTAQSLNLSTMQLVRLIVEHNLHKNKTPT